MGAPHRQASHRRRSPAAEARHGRVPRQPQKYSGLYKKLAEQTAPRMMEKTVRRNIKVSKKQTDRTLRALPGRQRGGLSKFVEEAVRWRIFHQTVRETREAFAGLPPFRADVRDSVVNDLLELVARPL